MKFYLFRTVPLSIIRSYSLYTQQLSSSRIRMFHPDPAARKLSANLYDIYHCCVYSEKLLMMGMGICPKHVDFHSKIKFEKISASVWFYYKELCASDNVSVQLRTMA
jgi:hypothetical protein